MLLCEGIARGESVAVENSRAVAQCSVVAKLYTTRTQHPIARRVQTFLILFASLISASAHAAPSTAATAGVAWLKQQAKNNGSYTSSLDVATPIQATAETDRTFRLLGYAAEVVPADAFLSAENYQGTEYLARQIIANADAGTPVPTLVTELVAHQNTDGGFGEFTGYNSTPFDTAFALEALANSGNLDSAPAGYGVAYLLQKQNANSSWLNIDGVPDVYTTALASQSLFLFRARFAAIPSAVANANNFLLSQRGANALWAEDFLSAQALLTLAITSSDLASIQQSADALRPAQRTDGSWADDVYTTALALHALFVAETRKGGTTATTGGLIDGYVLRAGTNEPLANASVTLTTAAGITAQSNADGYFIIGGVPTGDHTLLASKPGFTAASAVVTVRTGQMSNAGSILLAQSAQTALIHGTIFDASSHAPLGGVTISLSGAVNYSATSATDGTFEFTGITANSYAVTFHKNGYYDITGSLTAAAGSTTAIQQGLTLQGAYLDNGSAPISGKVVDAVTDQVVAGAQLTLNGGATLSTAADGTFLFAAVPRGNYQLQVSQSGYESRGYSFVFAAGASGDLGSLQLFPATGGSAPTTLTLVGKVVDGVDSHVLIGASIAVTQTGQTLTTNIDGHFTLSGLTGLSVDLTITASDHQTRSFSTTASSFGEVSATFALQPAGGSATATSSTLSGTVIDAISHQPIAGVHIDVGGTVLSVTTGVDGSFQLTNLKDLSFILAASAAQYTTRSYPVSLTQYGSYSLNIELTPAPALESDRFQILTLNRIEQSSGANTVQTFAARIANLKAEPQTAVVLGDILDATGAVVATVSPYAPQTTTPSAQIAFAANATVDLIVPWSTVQFPPGAYRLILRVVEPGTISRDLPKGVILTQSEAYANIVATNSIAGQLGINPPLTQAGSSVPVALTALIINTGNVPLTGASFTLTIADPTSGQILKSAQAIGTMIEAGKNLLLDFGGWAPTATGNLPITVRADDSNTQGTISGVLYVGDKASGTFTVNKTVVPLGTQTVHANVALQGVDVRSGASTDPLFAAVKESVRKGGLFVGAQSHQWNQTNRCLGCHIQAQSFTGMAAAMDKAAIDPAAVQYLYNDIAGSMQSAGNISPAYAQAFPQTQTTLGIWALSGWHDAKQVFRTLYRGAVFQMSRMNSSGNQSWWSADHCSVWVCNNQGQTMTTVKGLAAALRMSAEIGTTPINDYVFDDTGYDFGARDMMGVQKGPDGWIWYLDYSGVLYARNLATQETRVVASDLSTPSIGLAIRADGTAYVSSSSAVTKIAPNGTKTTILSGGGVQPWDIALGPDGALYVADATQILRITADDQVSQFVASGLFNRPTGLSFDADGNLFVSNYGAWNILKITPSGAISVFADGLPFQPVWLKRGGDGYLYALSQQYSNNGFVPAGVFRIDAQGYVERLPLFNAPNRDGYNALGVLDGDVYVNNGADHHLYRLRITTQDTSQLAAMRDALAGAARYTLATYNDNNGYNDIHAMRLITLAEARTQISDTVLQAQVDTAVADIATLLRARQRPDGGWTYSAGRTVSDPYTTAFVGLALEYTNPSVNDPVVRNSITYLLNAQLADGSWPYQDGVFTTKLGPASFVMAYMPQALERLGGIDADLHLTTPASVQLSNPSITPTAQTTALDGSTSYTWSLQGVTTKGRNVDFDLTLANMGYQEDRAVASAAYLEFANSFSSDQLRWDVEIPHVRAVSDLALAVATAQTNYAANTDVAITSIVNNIGPPASSGQVHVTVRAADGTPITDLGTTAFGNLATGASAAMLSTWNTGTLLAGSYQVYAQLYDASGHLIDERIAGFNIVTPAAVLTATVTPDKSNYQAWDSVQLTSRVRNSSANAVEPASIADLTVHTPAGALLYSTSYQINSLTPGALTDLLGTVKLSDAVSGDYSVQLVIKDAFTRTLIATATSSFHVTRNEAQALSGTIAIQSTRVFQGDSNLCTDTVTNLSSTALPNTTLIRSIVSLDTQAVIATITQVANFAAKQQQILPRSVATSALPVGAYACVLAATLNGTTRQLAAIGFDVVQPPIRIDASASIGPRGRLLVLMDDSDAKPCAPIKDIELWTPFRTSLPADAKVDVELQDANGSRVDLESVTLSQYRGTINKSVGKGADLAITGISADVLTVTIGGATQLNGGYRVIATANGASLPPMVVDSGAMGTSCGWPVGIGAHFGDFSCSKVHLPTGASAPTPPAAEPTFSAQRTFLENLLKVAGWSYKIVIEDEDFEHELRSGAYSEYALFAEREKLDEDTQKALREAVNMGAGLLDAGEHDSRQHGFDAALGIMPNGQQPQATGVNLTSSLLSQGGSATLAFRRDALRTALAGATPVGTFTGVPVAFNAAVTTYTYGQGKSVYVGYDVLAEATQAGSSSLEASLLQNALDYVKPSFTQTTTSQIVPIRVTLTNKGVATTGQVLLPLPTGTTLIDPGSAVLTGNTLTWSYTLAVNQVVTVDAWIRLPAQSGVVVFDALVQTYNNGSYVDYSHARLTINATGIATLADAKALAATSTQFLIPRLWLGFAQFWLDHGYRNFAVLTLLQATDGTINNPNPQAPLLRLDIDQTIWNLNRGL